MPLFICRVSFFEISTVNARDPNFFTSCGQIFFGWESRIWLKFWLKKIWWFWLVKIEFWASEVNAEMKEKKFEILYGRQNLIHFYWMGPHSSLEELFLFFTRLFLWNEFERGLNSKIKYLRSQNIQAKGAFFMFQKYMNHTHRLFSMEIIRWSKYLFQKAKYVNFPTTLWIKKEPGLGSWFLALIEKYLAFRTYFQRNNKIEIQAWKLGSGSRFKNLILTLNFIRAL